jgi:predicted PurR-regulated permease PerM
MRVHGGQLHPVYRAVLLAAGLVVLALLIRQLATLLLAVLITVILAIPLSAAATKLERRGVPRVVGAPLALLFGLLVLAGIVALVTPSFVDQVDKFVTESPRIVTGLEDKVHDLTGAQPTEVGDRVQHFLRGYVDHPERLVGPLTEIGVTVASMIGALVFILLTAVFIAIRPAPLVEGALRLFPPDRRDGVAAIMERLRDAWIGWMQGLAVAMLVLGVIFYVGLRIVGLDFALVFAVLSALAVTVPYFGALASGVPPVLYGLTYSPGKALAVVAVYIVAHQIEGNIIAPLVMARAISLHPALIAVGVVVMGELLGAIGLIVAVPILAALVVLTDELWAKPLERGEWRTVALRGAGAVVPGKPGRGGEGVDA